MLAEQWLLWEGPSREPSVLTSVSTQDAMRSVTKQAIREARLKEIKEELLHSERLKVRRRHSVRRPRQLGPFGWEVTQGRTVPVSQ